MKTSLKILVIALLIGISGCGSSNTKPTEEEISFAVKEDLKNGKACFSIVDDLLSMNFSFPFTEYAAARWNQFEPLVKAGLVIVSDTKGVPNDDFNKSPREIFAKRFSLTTEGEKYYKEFVDNNFKKKGFCYAESELQEVKNVSEPKLTMVGTKAVKVSYTYTMKPYKWFEENKEGITNLNESTKKASTKLLGSSVGESTLVLTKKGWKHPDYAPHDDLIIEEPAGGQAMLDFASGSRKEDGIGAKLQRLILGL
jgi:hypothetical protein